MDIVSLIYLTVIGANCGDIMNDNMTKIIINNVQRERKTLSKYACQNRKGKRKDAKREKIDDRKNIRPVFFHDTDKIIHSLAYTRYIDKTQVFSLFENDHITHRVLHVQFVSKIARVIGRCLKLNEDLIEAIALGHDIGHTPFGHDGETFLNEICESKRIGHFYHNAQGVKLLQEIENKGNGLNLSLQVLDGILAHNGEILKAKYMPVGQKSWDDFEEEYRKCFQKKDYYKKIIPMTLEACVVRISDIISYIGRDFEDAITVKLIKRNSLPMSIAKAVGNSNDKIINTLVMDLIKNSYGKNYIMIGKDTYKALMAFIKFNKENIYKNQEIKTEEDKIKNIFEKLFKLYLEDIMNNKEESTIFKYFLNKMCDKYKKENPIERQVIDYLSGMTDDFLINQFKINFFPKNFGYTLKKPSIPKSIADRRY